MEGEAAPLDDEASYFGSRENVHNLTCARIVIFGAWMVKDGFLEN
jgi:hypothetical protein